MLKYIALVALSGSAGAVSRFMINNFFIRLFPSSHISIGVLVVNVAGSFIAGVMLASPIPMRYEFKLMIMVGFLGAFTTFSAFSFDSFILLRDGYYISFMANVFLNFALSIGAVAFAYYLFK